MTTQMVKLLEQRLIRGTVVLVNDSFKKAGLRGKRMIVASKGTVTCNQGDRCAGNWCLGLAVFVAAPDSGSDEKELAWRDGTTKICLTHLKDEEGALLVGPAAMTVARDAMEPTLALPSVSWEDLANAVADGEFNLLTVLARRLKKENENLKDRVIDAQQRLLDSYA